MTKQEIIKQLLDKISYLQSRQHGMSYGGEVYEKYALAIEQLNLAIRLIQQLPD